MIMAYPRAERKKKLERPVACGHQDISKKRP